MYVIINDIYANKRFLEKLHLLIQVYGICVEEPIFLVITEFLETGNLKDYLKKEEAKVKLTFEKLVRISENVSNPCALKLIHSEDTRVFC